MIEGIHGTWIRRVMLVSSAPKTKRSQPQLSKVGPNIPLAAVLPSPFGGSRSLRYKAWDGRVRKQGAGAGAVRCVAGAARC